MTATSPPGQIGPYELLAEAGRGGMSVVYHARDERDGREVALKVLCPPEGKPSAEGSPPDEARSLPQTLYETLLAHFLREAQIERQLSHPNIVHVFDAGESSGFHYMALEWMDGGTLAERLACPPLPMDFDEVPSIIAQLAAGLDYAHRLGYVHCDVKASNVLLAKGGRALIADFGIARRAPAEAGSGPEDVPAFAGGPRPIATLAYASPEQACGTVALDKRTDVYSLGILAYYMLTGQLPFRSDDTRELHRQVVEDAPIPPESLNPHIPVGMAYALARALSKDPRARYSTAGEFAAALQAGLKKGADESAYTAISFQPKPPTRAGGAGRLLAVVAGLLALLSLGVGLVALARPAMPFPRVPFLSQDTPLPGAGAQPKATHSASLPVAAVPAARQPRPTFTPITPSVVIGELPTAAPLFSTPAETSTLVVHLPRVPAMQEDFSQPEPWWPEVKDKNSWWRVANGAYRLTIYPTNTMVSQWRGVQIQDFSVAFDILSTQGRQDVHAGLILRANGGTDFIQVDLQPGAGCEVYARRAGQTAVLMPITAIPPPQADGSDRISVTAKGQQLQVGANGQTLATLEDPDARSGDIALYATSGADPGDEIAFGNFSFQPGADEMTTVVLAPYQDPSGQFTLHVPPDWTPSTDEHGTNFDAPDRFARVSVSKVIGTSPDDSPEQVAQAYMAQMASIATDIVASSGITRQLGTLTAFDQQLQAQVMGAHVTVHLLAVNDGGRAYAIMSAAEATHEPALRPLLAAVCDSFALASQPALANVVSATDTPAPSEGATDTVTPVAGGAASGTDTPSAQAAQAGTLAPVAGTAVSGTEATGPVAEDTASTVAASAAVSGSVTGFETWGTWTRGDETWGSFEQSDDQVHSGSYSGKLAYDIPANVPNNHHYVVFRQALPISGSPNALQIWVYGDGSGCYLNAWVVDNSGQQFQYTFGRIEHTGWKQMTAPLDLSLGWPNQPIDGDPNAKQMAYPISFAALVLDGEPGTVEHQGVIYLDDLTAGNLSSPQLALASSQAAPAQASTTAGQTPAPAPGAATGGTSTPAPGTTAAPAVGGGPPPTGRIAYTVWNGHTLRYDVYVYRLADGSRSLYVPYARQPDFSTDGQLVAHGDGGGMNGLVRVDASGNGKHLISVHPEDGHPSWSLTVVSVVFDSTSIQAGQPVIFLQQDAGYQHDSPPLKFNGVCLFGRDPVYLPNWRIAYAGCNYWSSGSTCGIYTTDSTSMPTAATTNPGDLPTGHLGSEIIFMAQRQANRWDVYTTDYTGSAVRQLTSGPGNSGLGAGSPDGNYIAFVTDREGAWSVYVMNADGSNQHKLFDLDGGYGTGDYDWTQERISWGP